MTKHFDDMVEMADTIGQMVNDRFSDGRERFTVLAMALCACAKWQGYSKEESAKLVVDLYDITHHLPDK